MAQNACSYCGADNASEASYCSRCQQPLTPAQAPRPIARPAQSPRSATPRPQTVVPSQLRSPAPQPVESTQADLDGPTRVGPPPTFVQRTPLAKAATAPKAEPTQAATGAEARPTLRVPPVAPRPQNVGQRPAAPAQQQADDGKTHITPARLSPLMQRLTPKVAPVSQQQTALLNLDEPPPPKAATPLPRPAPRPQSSAPRPPATAATSRRQQAAPSATKVQAAPQPAAGPLPQVAPRPAAARSAPPVVNSRAGSVPPQRLAQTVIIETPPLQNVHSETTVIASTPLRAPALLHQDPTVAERQQPAVRRMPRPLQSPDDEGDSLLAARGLTSSQTAASLDAPGETRTVRPAHLPALIAACCVDAVIILAVGWAWAALEMLLFDGSWPAERGGLEALAVWLQIYASVAKRAGAVTVAFALGYTSLGAHGGRTLGRAALGLTLVRTSGNNPSWPWALWHAAASVTAAALWGAGLFWMLVDSRRRTWGNVLSRTVVCSQ